MRNVYFVLAATIVVSDFKAILNVYFVIILISQRQLKIISDIVARATFISMWPA